MKIVTTKDDLYRIVEDLFDSHPPSTEVLQAITDHLWLEGHEHGYRSGHHWDDVIDSFDLFGWAEHYMTTFGAQQADELTQEMRSALGYGSVEYAEANDEFVVWPLGEPYSTPEQARNRISQLKQENTVP